MLELITGLAARGRCCILRDARKPDDLEGRVGGKLADCAYLILLRLSLAGPYGSVMTLCHFWPHIDVSMMHT